MRISLSIRASPSPVPETAEEAAEAVAMDLGRPEGFFGLGSEAFITADEQQPRKKRGRKPGKAKAKAGKGPSKAGKAGKRKRGPAKKSRAACEVDGEAEAAAVKGKRGRKKQRTGLVESATEAVVAGKPSKGSKKAAPKAKSTAAKVKAKAASKRPKVKSPAASKVKKTVPKAKGKSSSSYRSPCLNESDYKSKMSRKSGAYHRALKQARLDGYTEEDSRTMARDAASLSRF